MISLYSFTVPVHSKHSKDIGMDIDDQHNFEDYNHQPQENYDDNNISTHILHMMLHIASDIAYDV